MKPKKTILGSLIALGLSSSPWALPQDPTPVHGQVQIQNGANFVQILQQSPQAIINWNQFNIGLGETVRFLQPSQQAAILNRVTGLDPSVIQGMLQANGRVFLLNPNGILFGPNSVVDVGSFTASTLKMSNEDFLNGTYKLTQDNSLPLAALTNQGTIRVAEGGFVVLVSPLLDNQGMILAQSGQVNLGATTQATFSVDGRGLVQFVVPDGFDPQFRGGGQGGTVLLQPGQMSSLLSQVVTNPTLVEAGSFQPGNNGQVLAHGAEGVLLNSGTISTDSANGNGGTIRLDSSQATILPTNGLLSANSQAGSGGDVRLLSAGRTVSLGTISAAANGTGNGGFAEVSGKDLWLLGTVNVGSVQGTGGTILLDPTDITIINGPGPGSFDGQLPNPNGAGAGSVSVTAMQGQSAVQLNATHDVLYNGTGFNLGSTSLSVNAGNDIQFTTGGSILATTLTLIAGNDISISSPNSLTVGSTVGAFTAQAGRHVTLTANNGNLQLRSPVQTSVTATGGNLTTSSSQNSVTAFDAPVTNLNAGGNLTLNASDVAQSANNPINMSARNVTLQSLNGGSFNYRTGGLNVSAGEAFAGNADGFFSLRTFVGPLNITAGTSLTTQSGESLGLQSDLGRLTLNAPVVTLNNGTGSASLSGAQGVNVTASAGDFRLTAPNGAVSLASSGGSVNVTASQDLELRAGSGNLNFSSASGTRLEAGRDLTTSSSQNSATVLDGPQTDWTAGRNLTLNASDVAQSSNNPVNLSARNVTLQSLNGGSFNYRTGGLNVSASEAFAGNSDGFFSLRTFAGPLNLTAGTTLTTQSGESLSLQSDLGRLTLNAPVITLHNGTGSAGLSGAQGVNVTASAGDFRLTAPNGAVSLASSGGSVNVTASQDLELRAGSGNLNFSSASGTRLEAGRDLTTSSSQNSATVLDGPQTDWTAGRNLTLNASDVAQSSNNPVNLSARNVTLQSLTGGSFNYRTGALNVTATEDFAGTASGFFNLRTFVGPLNLTAGTTLTTQSGDSLVLQSDLGRLTLNAPVITLHNGSGSAGLIGGQGVNVTASAGDFRLTAPNGAVSFASSGGSVNVTASQDLELRAGSGNLNFSSASGTRLEAGRDLTTSSSQSSTTVLDGPQTDWTAGRNLTLNASDVAQSSNNPVNLSARNVTLQSLTGGSFNYRTGGLNVSASEAFAGNSDGFFSLRTFVGPLNITAGTSLTTQSVGSLTLQSDVGRLTLNAPVITLHNGSGSAGLSGAQGVNVTASAGDFRLTAPNGAVSLASSGGSVNVTASQDLELRAGSGNLNFSSASGTRLEAGRDLTTSSSQSSTTVLDGPQTDWTAGRNLTLNASDVAQSSNNPVNLSARNVTLQSLTGGSFNYRTGGLNVSASEAFAGNSDGFFSLRTFVGPLNLTAGTTLTTQSGESLGLQSDVGRLTLNAPVITLHNGSGSAGLSGAQGVNVTASAGDFRLTAPNGAVSLASSGGSVNVTASQDLELRAGSGNLNFSSASGTRLEAGRDLTTSSSQSSTTVLDGPQTDWTAGRNLTLNASDVAQSSNNPVNLSARNVTLQSLTGGSFNYRTGALNVTATEDFAGTASGFFNLRTFTGPLQVGAGGNLSVSASSATFQADTGGLELTAGNLAVSNVNLVAGSNGNVTLASAGNLSVGPVSTGSTANATLSGANITIESMQNISGGNYTITTPGNLTEITPATNPPTLTGLNITAGKAFNLNRPDFGFSIPNAGFLAGLVTGGNETLPAPNEARAASFHTFTTNPNDFDPGHVEFQTGDIYRDGVKIYGGTPPPDPPTPPPAPPPTPTPPPAPIEIPVTPQEAVQQQSALSPEQRSQILAQSNLALGNLGSFSRVLSDSERAHLTVRQDSLHQTWALDPFSPTLALTVPGGEPPVLPSELAQLTALLLMNSPGTDVEEKNRQAYNVIVDQELREIWEVRYWRHLLEDIIIWEDRE